MKGNSSAEKLVCANLEFKMSSKSWNHNRMPPNVRASMLSERQVDEPDEYDGSRGLYCVNSSTQQKDKDDMLRTLYKVRSLCRFRDEIFDVNLMIDDVERNRRLAQLQMSRLQRYLDSYPST